MLPNLTVNRSFMETFLTADTPCCALGMVEVDHQLCGFVGLRPDTPIPEDITTQGFSFGNSLYGSSEFEVIHFGFHFYGFETYNVLFNPNNLIVQTVIQTMLKTEDYFFFALDGQGTKATAFKSEMHPQTLKYLKLHWGRLQNSTTSPSQYLQALSSFSENPEPPGIMMDWVCRDNVEFLDLTEDRLELNPAAG